MHRKIFVSLFVVAIATVSTLMPMRKTYAESRSSTVHVSVRVISSAKITAGTDPQVVCRECNPSISVMTLSGTGTSDVSSAVNSARMIVVNF